MKLAEYGNNFIAHVWNWVLVLYFAKFVFTQPDVIFTAEPCGQEHRGSYAPVPNDPHHYKQCGPAGFFWILPCAVDTQFSVDAQACVPKGSKSAQRIGSAEENRGAESQSSEHESQYPQVQAPAVGGDHKSANRSDHSNIVFLSGASDGEKQRLVIAPKSGGTTAVVPTSRQPPVKIVIENQGKVSQPPAPLLARDKHLGKQAVRQQQQESDAEQEEEEEEPPTDQPQPVQAPSSSQSILPLPRPQPSASPYPLQGPGPQLVMLPYPYPMLPYPPGLGPPNQNGGLQQHTQKGESLPFPPLDSFPFSPISGPAGHGTHGIPPPMGQIPFQAIGGPVGHSGHGHGTPHIPPPPFFLMPPPPPPRPTAEPEPPRLVTLVETCVENGTCSSEDEAAALDVFCLHDTDPTRYFVCSPHPELSGVWVEQQCPAGLHFSGERCDRPARTTSSNSVLQNIRGGAKNRILTSSHTREPERPRVKTPSPPPARVPQSQLQLVYQPSANTEQQGGPSVLALPQGAEFVVDPNTSPQPQPAGSGNPWQYALVNSAGVVQIHQGPPPPGAAPLDNHLPPASLTSVGHQQASRPSWYIRPLSPAVPPSMASVALPAPPSMTAVQSKTASLETAPPIFPTPPPAPLPSTPPPAFGGPQLPGPPNKYPSPNRAGINSILPIPAPPRWPQQATSAGTNPFLLQQQQQQVMWQNPQPIQLQPMQLQNSGQNPGSGPFIDQFGMVKQAQVPLNPFAASALSQETLQQLLMLQQQQQQQQAQGMLQVVPAIPGSRVASNQYPASGLPISNSISQFSTEYIYPYGQPSPSRPIGFPYYFQRENANGANGQLDNVRMNQLPLPAPGRHWPMVGQRCSLLVAPQTQIVADPGNRRSFYMCIPQGGDSAINTNWWLDPTEGVWSLMECPEDTVFNTVLKVCDKSTESMKSQKVKNR